jgi:hypothetical protein
MDTLTPQGKGTEDVSRLPGAVRIEQGIRRSTLEAVPKTTAKQAASVGGTGCDMPPIEAC